MTAPNRLMALVAIMVASAGWVAAGTLNSSAAVWGWLDLSDVVDEARRAEQLRRQGRAVAERLTCRAAVLKAVIDGRISLAKAGAAFRRLGEERASYVGGKPPTEAADAVWYEEVVRFVGASLNDDPERRAAVTARLEAELSRLAPTAGPGEPAVAPESGRLSPSTGMP